MLKDGESKLQRGEVAISLDENGNGSLPDGLTSSMTIYVNLESLEEPMRKALNQAVKEEVESTAKALAQLTVEDWIATDDNGKKFHDEAKAVLQRLPSLTSEDVFGRVAAALHTEFQKGTR